MHFLNRTYDAAYNAACNLIGLVTPKTANSHEAKASSISASVLESLITQSHQYRFEKTNKNTWKKLLLSDEKLVKGKKVEETSLRDGRVHVKNGELHLNGCTTISEEELVTILETFPGLTVIEISGIAIHDSTLEVIARLNPELKELNISQCVDITTEGLNYLAEKMLPLEKLDTSYSPIPDGGYNSLLEATKESLKKWNMSYTVRGLGISTLEQLANSKKLIALDADNAYLPPSLTEEAFLNFVRSCPQLQRLSLYTWSILTDDSLKAISESCRDINSLNFNMASNNFSAEGVVQFLTNTPSLRRFFAPGFSFNFTDDQLSTILTSIPNMEALSIGGLATISTETYSSFTECSKLQYLTLNSFTHGLTDDVLANIINTLKELRYLQVMGLGLTGSFVTQINNPKLRALYLYTNLKDVSSWQNNAFSNSLNLRQLYLPSISEPGSSIFNLVRANPNLKMLMLSNSFSNEEITALPQTNLKKLAFWDTIATGDAELANFLERNPKLRKFKNGYSNTGPLTLSALSKIKTLDTLYLNFSLLSDADSISRESKTGSDNMSSREIRSLNDFNGVRTAYLVGLTDKIAQAFSTFTTTNNLLTLAVESSNISSEAIVRAVIANPTATRIALISSNMTDEGFNSILQSCLSLAAIQVLDTSEVTRECIDTAKQTSNVNIIYAPSQL